MINRNIVLLLFFVLLFVDLGCSGAEKIKNSAMNPDTVKTTNIDSSVRDWIEKNPSCKTYTEGNISTLSQKLIRQCFEKAVSDNHAPQNLITYLGENLKQRKLSESTLTKILETVAQGYAKNSRLIELLIKHGASTKNISLQLVLDGNSSNCESSMMILKNNKNLYKSSLTVGKGGYAKTDLHYLVDTRSHRKICSKVAGLLISYNPKTLNILDDEGNTPLHYFLTDSSLGKRDTELAKKLMTKINVNQQTLEGNTPLHLLLSYNSPNKEDLSIVKAIVALGGKLTLKNKKGVTAKDFILKRLDLLSVLKN